MSKIVLVGYMGSGKTTIGKILANQLNIPFFDLDSLIEEETGLSISEIFTNHGEIWFRKKEHLLLNKFIKEQPCFVLSLGGGTPCYANNHLILQHPDVISIYLKAQIATLIARLVNELDRRPLLQKNSEHLAAFIGQHLFERSYFYNFSKLKLATDNLSPNQIVKQLTNIIKKTNKN